MSYKSFEFYSFPKADMVPLLYKFISTGSDDEMKPFDLVDSHMPELHALHF